MKQPCASQPHCHLPLSKDVFLFFPGHNCRAGELKGAANFCLELLLLIVFMLLAHWVKRSLGKGI